MSLFFLVSWILPYLLLFLATHVLGDPATLAFTDCFDDEGGTDQYVTITDVYAQVVPSNGWNDYLNLTVIGESSQQILGRANQSSNLATLFTSTSVLTLSAWSNSSFLCSTLRPPSPLPPLSASSDGTFCPVSAGPFAFSSSIPLGFRRALTTLDTRLRAVDPFGKEVFCLDVFTTPISPRPGSPYGAARVIFWSTISLAIAYYIIVGGARIISAWGRGISRKGVWTRLQSAGYILASAISGEQLGSSPALMRFCTPSMRDVIFHSQWCSIIAMVAIQWPQFVYPLLTQTAWSTLTYSKFLICILSDRATQRDATDVTLTTSRSRWNPLSTAPFNPPAAFSDQLKDPTSPLFIDPLIPNTIFTLPDGTARGMQSFAYAIGIRPQDLFPVCIILFLSIVGVTITLSVLICVIEHFACVIGTKFSASHPGHIPVRHAGSRSPSFGKKMSENSAIHKFAEENKSTATSPTHTSRGGLGRFSMPLSPNTGERTTSHRAWWRLRSDIGSFHGNVLHGNLVRILVLFHLPVSVFSSYHMTLPRSQVPLSGIVLAALSFVVFSILLPAHLVLRLTMTTTNKLYDETRTLLSLGPLYNHYRHGSQMFASLLFATNIAFGVTIGAGQKSGTAQAIIILVIEVISALVTSVWLPWGNGASMGLISFLFCVARIVIAVLLVILTPVISISSGPGGWVAYGILVILALVYLALVLMLLVKVVEALVRIAGLIGFDRSKHVIDSGLLGACSLLGCCGPRRRRRGRNTKSALRYDNHVQSINNVLQPPEFLPHLQHNDSDLSSYLPPVPGNAPPFLSADSRKDSANSGPPPSVLKPEHANRPYREDFDRPYRDEGDDEGFIMGAWKPFPKPGYITVNDATSSIAPLSITTPPEVMATQSSIPQTSPTTNSGFSRVGGGRAHFDSPYAIQSGSTPTLQPSSTHALYSGSTNAINSREGSTHAFPSIGPRSPSVVEYEQAYDNDDDDPPPSLANVARHPEYAIQYDAEQPWYPISQGESIPSGAMRPSHIRTKSQSAIIEDDGGRWVVPGLARNHHLSQSSSTSLTVPGGGKGGGKSPVGAGGLLPGLTAKFMIGGGDERDNEDDNEPSDVQLKKKPWYHLRRSRGLSTEGFPALEVPPPSTAVDEELGGLGEGSMANAQPQRSFVVIRRPPQGSQTTPRSPVVDASPDASTPVP